MDPFAFPNGSKNDTSKDKKGGNPRGRDQVHNRFEQQVMSQPHLGSGSSFVCKRWGSWPAVCSQGVECRAICCSRLRHALNPDGGRLKPQIKVSVAGQTRTRKPRPETQNQKSEIRNPKPETPAEDRDLLLELEARVGSVLDLLLPCRDTFVTTQREGYIYTYLYIYLWIDRYI